MARSSKAKPADPTKDVEKLLRGCRRDGGAPVIAKISKDDGTIVKTVLADAGKFYADSLIKHKNVVAQILHASDVKIQTEIKDPLIALGVSLGGVVVSIGKASKDPAVRRGAQVDW